MYVSRNVIRDTNSVAMAPTLVPRVGVGVFGCDEREAGVTRVALANTIAARTRGRSWRPRPRDIVGGRRDDKKRRDDEPRDMTSDDESTDLSVSDATLRR